MHIGLLNMMPMPHWKRQKDNFFDWWERVIKSFNSTSILLAGLKRSPEAQAHMINITNLLKKSNWMIP